MTTFDQPSIDFDAVSEPIEGVTKATVELVANDWLADRDWDRFEEACEQASYIRGDDRVDPNIVRDIMAGQIEPRRYSAFWSRAAGKNGFLVADGWTTNTDTRGGNAGKPQRMYRLREQVAA